MFKRVRTVTVIATVLCGAGGVRAQVPYAPCADTNGDCKTDIVDALFIAQATVGLRTLTCPSAASMGPRFVDNRNGTVTDTKTGLMWEKKTTDGTAHDVNNTYSWANSGSRFDGTAKTIFLDTLNDVAGGGAHCFAGYCDWRLPSVGQDGGIAELETIVDATQGRCGGATSGACVYPALGPAASGLFESYWSSTSKSGIPTDAWTVDFRNGGVGVDAKDGSHRVRAVRGHLIDNGDGTVTDTRTGLMWEKKTTDGSVHNVGNTYTWSIGAPWNFDGTAKSAFLDKLNDVAGGGAHCFAGYCDWRLPSVGQDGGTAELETIVDATQGRCGGGSGACVYLGLGPTASAQYWSSTSSAANVADVWGLNFETGGVRGGSKTDTFYVRAVRGGL